MAEGGDLNSGDLKTEDLESVNIEGGSLEEVVTCKICYLFMEDARILLPCLHNFCANCVSKLDRRRQKGQITISCPLCREDITEENIHRNRTMAELMDIVKAKKQKSGGDLSDFMCSQCDITAVVYKCTNCDGILCMSCEPRHSRLPKCKNKILLLEEAEEVKRKSTVIYCSKHSDEPIKINCKTCNQAICAECKFTTHDRHESESLESALQRYREMVKKALDGMKKKKQSKESQISQIHTTIAKVKSNQIKEQMKIDERYDRIISQVAKEKTDLSSYLEIQCGAQLKELQLELESLENSLSCDNSIQTWTEAVMTNTDGGVLLTELQSGLFNKMQQQASTLEQTDSSCKTGKLYRYKPSQIPLMLLGQIDYCSNEVDHVSSVVEGLSSNQLSSTSQGHKQATSGFFYETQKLQEQSSTAGVDFSWKWPVFPPFTFTSTKSSNKENVYSISPAASTSRNVSTYRHMNIDLNTLNWRQPHRKFQIDIGQYSARLCLFQGKLYIPCCNINLILVFSLNGERLKTKWLQCVHTPKSLHPLNSTQLLLASRSGLHVLDSNTLTVISQLAFGRFHDVCADGDTIAALKYDENKVYLWDVKQLAQPKHSFTITLSTDDCRINTLCCGNSEIYVCCNNMFQVYSIQGTIVQEENLFRDGDAVKECHHSLCIIDKQGNTLIAHNQYNAFQWVSADGYSAPPTPNIQVNRPYDAVIAGDTLYVLHDSGQTLTAFSI